jgi:hypothetical protein
MAEICAASASRGWPGCESDNVTLLSAPTNFARASGVAEAPLKPLERAPVMAIVEFAGAKGAEGDPACGSASGEVLTSGGAAVAGPADEAVLDAVSCGAA